MDRLPPLKPQASPSPSGTPAPLGHGTAKAASRSGPMHPHALVVSVHDVCPKTWQSSAAILSDLAALGVPHCSLLVVPDHHGHGHFLQHPEFCQWLVERAQEGHEVVIHGYYHYRQNTGAENLSDRLTTQFYTANEGEFFDMDAETAAALVQQARDDFGQLGLRPEGFIAPAWLLSKAAEGALLEAGCEYTTRLREVTDLRTGKHYGSQSLVWSVRSAWRRQVSLLWNATLFRSLQANPLLRISIHPVDVQHGSIWKQVRKLVGRARRDRAPFTYERWISRERTFRVMSR